MLPAVFVPLPAMPLNPNGKVDRAALPAPESSRPDLGAAYLAPRTRVEEILAQVWSEVLGVERVGVHDDFFDLGGDSILSIRVMVAARRAGLSLTPRQMFADPTIAQLAQSLEGAAAPAAVHADQGTVSGEVPLTPIQHWFSALKWPQGPYNQSVRLRWNEPVDEAALRDALGALVRHHDALRLRWSQTQHIVAEESAQLVEIADLSTLPTAEIDAAVRSAADGLQASVDPASGPLIRVLILRYGPDRPDEVQIAVHHLAVDTVSWQILLEDLAAAYCGEALASKTTSFQHWAHRLADYARSDGFATEAAYWRQQHEAVSLPLDHPGGRNTQDSATTVTRTLDSDATEALLRSAHAAYRTRTDELLLAALARTLARHTGDGAVHIDLEGHGREQLFDDVDLSRTVGWFTAIHPLRLHLSDPEDTSQTVKAVKEHLRGTPHRGIGYGIARYLRDPAGQWPDASVSFNYHGQVRTAAESGLFSRIPTVGVERHPEGARPYPLDVDAAVIDGALTVHWTYSTALHDSATVEGLADTYLRDLASVLRHCQDRAPSPSAARSSHSEARAFLDCLFRGVPATRMRMARYGVPGLGIAVVADGAVVDAWGEGITHAGGVPVRADTVFQAGSVSKHVTTLGVLSLVRSGVLDLDEDVDRYLRSWRPERLDPARPVTLRTLLSHTAGMSQDQFDGDGARRSDQPVPSIAQMLSGDGPAATRPVRAELRPGERFRYSGNHFVVVEQVMTDATNRPFRDLMRDLVFEPLGMRDSGYGTPFARSRAAALGHAADGTPIDGGWRVYPDATGGLWVSAGDLARVAVEIQQALAGTGSIVLDKELAVEMLSPVHPADTYGLGTVLRASDGVCWFGHSGETAGYRCYTAVGLESGAGVVLAANGDAGGDLIIDLLAQFGLEMQVWVDRGTGAPRRHGR
jgi:non-ribosomal peptide synthase protein (TIGR01720 family)